VASSSFEPVVTIHCLATLDLGAGVELLINCLDLSGCAFHGVVDGLDNDMVNSSFFCATLTGCKRGHIPFVQAGMGTSDTSAGAVKPDPRCP